MKILNNKKYDAVVSLRQDDGTLKIHSYLSNRTPEELYQELAERGIKEEEISIFWLNRKQK